MNFRLSCIYILTTLMAASDLASGAWRFRRQDEEPPASEGADGDAAAGGAKACIMCAAEDCKAPRDTIVECKAMSELGLKDEHEKIWKNITGEVADFNDLTKYTDCFTLQIEMPKIEIRGCAPAKITEGEAEKEFCAVVEEKLGKGPNCTLCTITDTVCNNDTSIFEPAAKTSAAHRQSLEFNLYVWIVSAALVKLLL